MKRWLIGLLAIIVIGVGCIHEEAAENADENQAPELLWPDEVPTTQTDDKTSEINLVANFCASSVPDKQDNMRAAFKASSTGIRFLELGKIEVSDITEPLGGDIYGEIWAFFLCDAERHVTIKMVSSSIDPHLALTKGIGSGSTGDILAENDDSGKSLNAEISILLTRGAYRIAALANPEVRRNTGVYLLRADKR